MAADQFLENLRKYLSPMVESEMARAQTQNQSPFMVMPNSGFFAAHPRITHSIEGALMGAAQPVDDTSTGSIISSVARNLMGLPEARAQLRMRRAMAPLEAAAPLFQLYRLEQQMQDSQLDADYKRQLIAASKTDAAYKETLGKRPQENYGPAVKTINKDGKPVWGRQNQVTGVIEATDAPVYDPLQASGGRSLEERIVRLEEGAEEAFQEGDKELASILQKRAGKLRTEVDRRAGAGPRARMGMGLDTPDAIDETIKSQQTQISRQQASNETRMKEIRRQQSEASFLPRREREKLGPEWDKELRKLQSEQEELRRMYEMLPSQGRFKQQKNQDRNSTKALTGTDLARKYGLIK